MAGHRHLWVLIPAAGRSERFAVAGWKTPKPRLMVDHRLLRSNRSMLEHVLDTIPSPEWPRLAALPSDEGQAGLMVRNQRLHIMEVKKTRGQADTIRQMLRWIPASQLDETAVVVLNCDVVFLDPRLIADLVEQVERGFVASILVTESKNPAMSYAYPYPVPQKFVEKQVTGRHAMVGGWAFASGLRLLQALDWACCQDSGEPYLSHALGRIVGPKISRLVPQDMWLDLGTPDAAGAAKASLREPPKEN